MKTTPSPTLLSHAHHSTLHASNVQLELQDLLVQTDQLETQDSTAHLVLLDHAVLMDNLEAKDHPETLEHQVLLEPTDNPVLLERMALMVVDNPDCRDPPEHQVPQETLDLTEIQDRTVLLDPKDLLDNPVLLDLQVAMVIQELQEDLDYQETMPHTAHVHLDRPFSCHDSRTKVALLPYVL